ncbi:Conserved hypothetical protein CHP02466 [uncultured Caudovirales phage]|uniref:Uncharacterized protein n=1 Tax=uncultured Caudovirales phage TaxID=2100421 RepID=A0A6J5LCB9_9CAUD|nr:Conserved hypothetical protein CHP02466 [uncultured Caudovirales phage]
MIDRSIFPSTVEQSIWECPFWHLKTDFTDSFNAELLKELSDIAENFEEASDLDSLLDCQKPRLQELISFKKQTITDTFNAFLPDTQEAEFVAAKSWVNVNNSGERIEMHAHPDTSIACTYYIQGPDLGGDFYYVDTGKVGEHKTEIKKVTPRTGDLIFFPSYMLHGVEMNKGRTRVNLTTSFRHELTENSMDRFTLKSYINSMKRIKDL